MDEVQVIRHKHFVEGLSVRRIARDMGLNRRTVAKYLTESAPHRVEPEGRPQPVLGLVGPRIEALLEEWDGRLEGKHRVTSPRLHRQLVEEGYAVGERTVREYLAEQRRKAAEVYIPLVHRPGEEAQVDFFEVTVDLGRVRRQVWKFLMRLMYSGRDFVHLYDRAEQVCFLDGHVRAFAWFGGVARRVVYDNLTAAVKRVVGLKGRELTDRFRALASHYLFEPCFARPGEGHDKGGVESRGKAIRLQHLTPIVQGQDLGELSARVREEVDQRWRERSQADGRTFPALFEEERPQLRVMPPTAFEARRLQPVAISHCAIARVDGATYSLPSHWARLDAFAHVGPEDIRFECRGEEVRRARQARGGRNISYRHYLRELARKPQAVRQVAPELVAELGEPFGQLWTLLAHTHGEKQAARILAGVLGAIHDHGEAEVAQAVQKALAAQAGDAEAPLRLLSLADQRPAHPVLCDTLVPGALRTVEVESGRAADYDQLLLGGMS